jgi:hypothetical protein
VLDLGLTAAERRAFHAALVVSYRARTRFEILDRDEQVIGDPIQGRVLSGQVDVAAQSHPDRVLQLEFADDGRRAHFVPQGPATSALYADNFIRVERGIYVTELERWVDVPVFCGPITALERNGHTVSLTAVGKEARALEPAVTWNPPGPFGRGTKVVDAIRAVMRSAGERRFDMPMLHAELNHPLSLSRSSQAWKVASKLAEQVNRQLFYDGRGKLRLRLQPERTVWTFDTARNVVELPRFAFELEEVRNTIEVLGPEPDSKEPRPRVVVTPPPRHPLSPWRLARNGEPLHLVETLEIGAKRREVLRRAGERLLEQRLRAATHIEFDAYPVPHLEPYDEVALVIAGERTSFTAKEYTIPLVAGPMSAGYHKRVKSFRSRKGGSRR